jgi:hypothetical protein
VTGALTALILVAVPLVLMLVFWALYDRRGRRRDWWT